MHREGHVGLALSISSLIMWLLHRWDLLTLAIILGFSTFPDVDLRLGIQHRKWTHNIFFGLLSGLAFGYITKLSGLGFEPGFFGAFGGITLHILGDLLTYRSFAPFYPISKRKFALGLFRSDNRIVNTLMLIIGMITFSVLYYSEHF